MCGRYDLDDSPAMKAKLAIQEHWLRRLAEARWDGYGSHDVRPETRRPVAAAGNAPELEAMRWGWHPAWMKAPLINARWETVPTKSTFMRAFLERRCVIPATGYFEWQRDAKDKPLAKFMFRPADGGWMRFAGLWSESEFKGVTERRFLVLTRTMVLHGEIHDRTPVVLSPAAAEAWLDPKAPEGDLFDAAAQLGDDHLVVRPVTFDKEAGKRDGPHLVASIGEGWPW